MKELIERLERERDLTNAEFAVLLDQSSGADRDFLFEKGARRSGRALRPQSLHPRLDRTDELLQKRLPLLRHPKEQCLLRTLPADEGTDSPAAESGYALGFRTFVLQGGEDGWYTDERMTDIVRAMRQAYPDCAITLSLGDSRGGRDFQRLDRRGCKPLSAPPRNRGRSALRQASSSSP